MLEGIQLEERERGEGRRNYIIIPRRLFFYVANFHAKGGSRPRTPMETVMLKMFT